ncbi:MAG TPA: hypothetical protein VKA44_03885 [Gemmatimonadota bacterium]|nr:hypothetical protein [Gemmatimonadota bacterium]
MRRRGTVRHAGPARGSPGRAGRALAALALAAACAGLGVEGAAAQQAPSSLGVGVPVSVLPLQNAVPAPSGAWPGGESSLQATVDAFDAEVDFALSENRETARWTGPGKVVKATGRNPLLKVDPERLAFEGLDTRSDDVLKDILYEPLRGQLRSLSALLDTRLVVLPIRLAYRAPETDADGAREGSGDAGTGPPPGRVAVRVAVIDTRQGQVLWRGWVAGPPGEPDSDGALAGVAGSLVAWIAP